MPTIDYLACTYKERLAVDVMSDFMEVTEGFTEGRGAHGYKRCLRSDGVAIYWDGTEEMGVHVQVSGQGCGLVSESDRYRGVGSYVRQSLGLGARFVRCDVAVDDRQGFGSPEKLLDSVKRGDYVSSLEDYSFFGGGKKGVNSGLTVYVGDRTSDLYLCAYDKRLERMGRGCEDMGAWFRCEIRYKGLAGQAAALKVATEDSLEWGCRALADVLQVKVPNASDSNKSRWRDALWWRRVCGNAVREPLYVFRPVLSLEEKCEHFVRSYGQAMVVLDEASRLAERSPFFIEDVLSGQRHNLRPKSAIKISALAKAAKLADCHKTGISEQGEVIL